MRTLIGERVTDGVVLRNDADLLAARPLIASAVSGIVGGGAFRSLFRHAVLDAHRAIFERDRDTLTLTLADVGTVVAAALEKVDPKLAADLDAGEPRRAGQARASAASPATSCGSATRCASSPTCWRRCRSRPRRAALALVARPPAHRRATRGSALAAAGVAIVVVYTVARAIVVDRLSGPDSRDAMAAVWDAFLGDLRSLGWLLAGAGAVVAAAAASLIQPIGIEASAARGVADRDDRAERDVAAPAARRRARRRGRAADRATARGAADRRHARRRLPALQRARVGAADGLPAARPARRRRPRRRARGAALAARGGAARGGAADRRRRRRLRRRRRDRGARAGGDHRAATARPRCATGRSTRSCCPRRTTRCRCRCRGGSRPSTSARSAASSRTGSAACCSTRTTPTSSPTGVPAPTSAAASGPAAHDRAGRASARRASTPRCACASGSASAARASAGCTSATASASWAPRRWPTASRTSTSSSSTHPAEVVVVINQDYVTPADFVEAVGDAGLTRYVFKGLAREPWPTLREMIERDQRLVLLAENHAGAAPWYQLAYERLTEETPFDFSSASQLTAAAHDLPAQPRPGRRAAVPHQPLGHDRSGPAAERRGEGQRVRAAAGPREGVRAHPRPPPEPARRELLQARRPVPGGRRAQRR